MPDQDRGEGGMLIRNCRIFNSSEGAADLRARLEKALERSEMGYSERFEHDAERFYAETGFMAPGKSMPVEMYTGERQQEQREAAWQAFSGKLRDEFHALLRDNLAFLGAAAEREQKRPYMDIGLYGEESILELENEVARARLTVNDWHICATHSELGQWRIAQQLLIETAKALGRAEQRGRDISTIADMQAEVASLTARIGELQERCDVLEPGARNYNPMRVRAEQAEARVTALLALVNNIADRKTCGEERNACESDSGPYCSIHRWFDEDDLISEARRLRAEHETP